MCEKEEYKVNLCELMPLLATVQHCQINRSFECIRYD